MVQLIRPVNKNGDIGVKESFIDLIANVDISCCGVSYDGKHLYENYPNAVLHANSKTFSVNENAKMYIENRVIHRVFKLIERGWKKLGDSKSHQRDFKINQLLNNLDFDYTKEYEF